MELLTAIIIAVVIVSLISFVGISILVIRKRFLDKIINLLVAFSAGSLLATAFLELIPESYENGASLIFVIIGIMIFFVMEAIIHWHHHHNSDDDEHMHKVHPVVYLNIFGDAIHNMVDGAIIAASYLVSIPVGISTTIAIAAHEIPQELGDFAVLVSGGLSKKRALLLNSLSAIFSIIGALVSYSLLNRIQSAIPIINLIAAGGLIYIATADLFPRLHEEKNYKKIIVQALGIIAGVVVIWLLVKNLAE
ncbi:MAG: ZIP family metal transporter [Nanoarchaeota archaeon]